MLLHLIARGKLGRGAEAELVKREVGDPSRGDAKLSLDDADDGFRDTRQRIYTHYRSPVVS